MQLTISYWAGKEFTPLLQERGMESTNGIHYNTPFGEIIVNEWPGASADFYFFYFKISQPSRLQFNIPPQSVCMLVSEVSAFVHLWNGHSRWLAKTMGDIFYHTESLFRLEFPETGTYGFSLIQIHFSALKPLQSLNAQMQLLTDKVATQQMVCLNGLPFVLDLKDRIMLEDLRLIEENEGSQCFISARCLLVFIRVVEKLIRQSQEFYDGFLPGYDQEYLERAAAEISAEPGRKISIPELAKKNGLTPSRFKFLFKQQFSLTIHAFVIKIRMDRAAALITHTQLSIREIAMQVGYTNDSSFSYFFKKKTGMSPTALRRKRGVQAAHTGS